MSEVKNIPDGWVETSLGQVGKVITGKTPSKDNPEDWGNLVDFITPTEIKSENKFIFNCPRKLSAKGLERFSKMILPEKSVIVTCIGSDMGKVVLNKDKALANQQINSIVVNEKNYSDFIYYLLKDSYKILRKKAEGSGSTMPILNKSTFENLEFYIPQNIYEQKSIAEILTSFDDKIELLQAQNKTLEATAQTIFAEWFGKYSVDDELPDGWRVGTLETITTLLAGGDRPKNTTALPTEKNNIPIYSNGITNYGLYGFTDTPKIYDESVTVSARGTIGFPCLRTKPYVPIVRLISVIPNQEYLSSKYLFLWLKNQNISGTGTTQEQLTIPDFKRIQIIIPPFELMNKFSSLMNTVYDKIDKNNTQIQTLTKTRDELLPRLMSGEVRVSEL